MAFKHARGAGQAAALALVAALAGGGSLPAVGAPTFLKQEEASLPPLTLQPLVATQGTLMPPPALEALLPEGTPGSFTPSLEAFLAAHLQVQVSESEALALGGEGEFLTQEASQEETEVAVEVVEVLPADRLAWPSQDKRVGSPFGPRFHPILKYWRLHMGIDIGDYCGAPVRAAGPGKVLSVGVNGGYGNRVVIDHGNKLFTTYNHLQSWSVKNGQEVATGDVIGLEGTTGLSTGCHIHFEVLKDGFYTNPENWLNGTTTGVQEKYRRGQGLTMPSSAPTTSKTSQAPTPSRSPSPTNAPTASPTPVAPPKSSPTPAPSTPSATPSPTPEAPKPTASPEPSKEAEPPVKSSSSPEPTPAASPVASSSAPAPAPTTSKEAPAPTASPTQG